jgi:hypothetical protein
MADPRRHHGADHHGRPQVEVVPSVKLQLRSDEDAVSTYSCQCTPQTIVHYDKEIPPDASPFAEVYSWIPASYSCPSLEV